MVMWGRVMRNAVVIAISAALYTAIFGPGDGLWAVLEKRNVLVVLVLHLALVPFLFGYLTQKISRRPFFVVLLLPIVEGIWLYCGGYQDKDYPFPMEILIIQGLFILWGAYVCTKRNKRPSECGNRRHC
jgi:quinol-cytochrome oxidoreductase complex cytochrome b subunit